MVSSAKVLGVVISSDLKCSAHIDSITTKAAIPEREYLEWLFGGFFVTCSQSGIDRMVVYAIPCILLFGAE